MIHHVLIIFVKKAKRREKEALSFFQQRIHNDGLQHPDPNSYDSGQWNNLLRRQRGAIPQNQTDIKPVIILQRVVRKTSGHIIITPIRTQHAQFHTISTRLRKVRVCGGVLKVPTGRIGVEVACKYAERLNEVS